MPVACAPAPAPTPEETGQHAGAWFVYLLECAGGRIYTGVTPRLAARMAAHGSGRGARFTRMHRPRQLLAARPFASRGEALRMELRIKRYSPAAKRALARDWAHAASICRLPSAT